MTAFVIPVSLLEEARVYFERCGTRGCEGTAMIMGGPDGLAHRLVIPDQRATPLPYCSVEVTRQGKFDLRCLRVLIMTHSVQHEVLTLTCLARPYLDLLHRDRTNHVIRPATMCSWAEASTRCVSPASGWPPISARNFRA
jgi:hypothetical protein